MIQEIKISRVECLLLCLILVGLLYVYADTAFSAVSVGNSAHPVHQCYIELVGDSSVSGRYVLLYGQNLGEFLENFEVLDKKIKAKYQYIEITRSKSIKISQN